MNKTVQLKLSFIFSILLYYYMPAMGSEIEVYMADPEVRIAQKIYCQIKQADLSDKLQATYDGKLIYEKNGNLQQEEIFIINYSNQKAGNHNLIVRILDQKGQEKSTFSKTWSTLHDGIPEVGIDENNAIRVKGELFFPIYPATADIYIDQWMQYDLANTGSDMHYLHPNFNDYTKEEFKEWLDRCAGLGIRNIGPSCRWGGIGNIPQGKGSDFNSMQDYVKFLKDHPGVLMWQWSDEPDGGGSGSSANPDEIRSWTNLCHKLDTNHPHAVNLTAYGWARDAAWYIDRCKDYSYLYGAKWYDGEKKIIADVIGFDFYPIEYATKYPNQFGNLTVNFETLAKALDRIKEYNYNLVPIFSWNENCDLHPDRDGDGYADGPGSPYLWTPAPTPEEMWAEYWIKIIHGVKGFKIHTAFDYNCRGFDQYTNGQPPCNSEIMNKFLLWIENLKYALLGPEYNGSPILDEELNDGRIDILVKESEGKLYIFAANLKKQNEKVRFNFSELSQGTNIEVYDEARTIITSQGYFEDNFSELEVHIYIIPNYNTSIEQNEQLRPNSIKLFQNYPNPFNPKTEISFFLPIPQHVSLKVFDLGGHELSTLLNGCKPAGMHTIRFDGKNLPCGMYFYKMIADTYQSTKKMLIVK